MAASDRLLSGSASATRPSWTDVETAGPGSGPATPSLGLFGFPAGAIKLVAIAPLAATAQAPIAPTLIARLSGRVGGAD